MTIVLFENEYAYSVKNTKRQHLHTTLNKNNFLSLRVCLYYINAEILKITCYF
jgi:hypothetical protein